MKRQTMYSNVNQKLAESFANRQIKSKSSNEELIQMITRVRSLEDQLLAEQYRQELLKQQNKTYKEALHSLQTNNELQQMRLQKLDEEMELHSLKNKELHTCQESLKSLETQIKELTRDAQKKAEECESLQIQTRNISQECQNLKRQHKQIYQKHTYLNSLIMDYVTQSYVEEDIDDRPIDFLRLKIQSLRQSIAQTEIQESNLSRQQSQTLHKEKQKTIKLQYEQKLLSQREQDEQKINQISKICQSQQNLESVVQEMLIKQDQLLEQLNNSKLIEKNLDEKIRRDIQDLEQSWDEQRQKYQKELRQLKKSKQGICFERDLMEQQVRQKKAKMMYQNDDHDLFFKINSELSALKRLRIAQQKNNYLRIKIKQFTDIKNMLLREKEIVGSLNIY